MSTLISERSYDAEVLWMWLAPSFCSTAHLPYPRMDGEAEDAASAAMKLEVLAQELGIDLVAQYMAVGAVDDQTIRDAIKNDIDPALLSSVLVA